MPQTFLPLFPDGGTHDQRAVVLRETRWGSNYFHGVLPVFSHHEQDRATFR